MLKEEWRLHRSLIGKYGSGFFPFYVFVFSAALAYAMPTVLTNLSYATFLLMLHASSALYGLFVGSMGHVGEQIWSRRLGQINVLLQLPQYNPLSFRRTMGFFYLKDALFYVVYTFIPLTCGIAVGASFVGIGLSSVALLGVTMVITFMIGMSVSFLLSAMTTRSKPLAAVLGLSLTGGVSAVWPLRLIEAGQLMPPLGYWSNRSALLLVISIVFTFIISGAAMFTIRERTRTIYVEHVSNLLPTEEKFTFTGDLSVLVAKEWTELRRSGVMRQVTTGFVGTILGVYFIIRLFERGVGLPLPFNVVSYSGFVGFMGVLTYSWITNMEHNESLNTVPVTVYQVILAKVILYLLLTSGISAAYVVLIGLLRGETALIPLSLLVAGGTSVYSVAVAAYLTGLWTNTLFFDVKVISKFALFVVPPLVAIEVGSMYMGSGSVVMGVIITISLMEAVLSIPIFGRVRGRWKKAPFAFTINETQILDT
jgi:hypothetical protein